MNGADQAMLVLTSDMGLSETTAQDMITTAMNNPGTAVVTDKQPRGTGHVQVMIKGEALLIEEGI